MTAVAHLSDLHFGSEDAVTTTALIDELNREALDLVILSGDLTMAARRREFEAARDFIDALNAPVLAVPGNHDLTPYKLWERFLRPYKRWQTHVDGELQPVWGDGTVAVVGLNTARRARLGIDWSHGSLSRRQIRGLGARFDALDASPFRIVVAHHPFLAEDTEDLSDRPRIMVNRAADALKAFAAERVDLVTAGHLHRTYAAQFSAPVDEGAVLAAGGSDGYGGGASDDRPHKVTVIQAGTALSARRRGEVNSFNLIEADSRQLSVYTVGWLEARWERDPDPMVTLAA